MDEAGGVIMSAENAAARNVPPNIKPSRTVSQADP